ncbi:MAG TPA: iron-containing redox enzyme family protein [Glaciihabitans sp.]|nr:iron-containing redox enzyme family protein [Glaciihabitans sp.]
MSNTPNTIHALNTIDLLPLTARGPLSSYIVGLVGQHPNEDTDLSPLRELVETAVAGNSSLTHDDDVQVSLFVLYGLHYGSLGGLGAEWEWNPELIAARGKLERAFEAELRALIPVPETPEPTRAAVAQALAVLTAVESGPSLSRFVAKKATPEQLQEFLIQRSIYTLREADPHSWAIPRLSGRPKAALVEIQADEYGDGRPERMHAEIFARTMRAMGLDSSYGHYIDVVPAITLASLNMMSMFGLNRRLRGAIVGHLAAFEMTSAIPNQMYGNGFRRHGHGESVTDYFDEHVEADAVHEQIAAHDLAGSLAEDEPALVADIMFGASACLTVDGWAGDHMLTSWTNEQSSLRSKDTL